MAIVTVGIDLAKNVFALHGVNETGVVQLRQPKVGRSKLNELVAALPQRAETTAAAIVAMVGNGAEFSSGRQFAAWLGLVPRQHSSGGKSNLGGITKRGDTYVRTLLIQGAKSALMTAHKRSDPISKWAAALRDRSGWQKAVVALANKNARILWAVMTKGEAFDARHVSVKPATPVAAAAAA